MAIIIFIVVAALVEWGALTAFRAWIKGRTVWFWLYCMLTVLSYAFLVSFNFAPREFRYPLLNAFVIIFFGKLLATLVLAIWLGVNEVRSLISSPENTVSESRRSFIKKSSAVVGLVPVGLMSWGIFRTAGNFKIHTVKLTLKGMPDSFKGFKIVQVSDIHTGSFFSHGRMEEAVSEILEQNADIVVFSGDLVNNRTDECYEYMDILAKIQAPLGVYSTLGNHD